MHYHNDVHAAPSGQASGHEVPPDVRKVEESPHAQRVALRLLRRDKADVTALVEGEAKHVDDLLRHIARACHGV